MLVLMQCPFTFVIESFVTNSAFVIDPFVVDADNMRGQILVSFERTWTFFAVKRPIISVRLLMRSPVTFMVEALVANITFVLDTIPVDLSEMLLQNAICFVRILTLTTLKRSLVVVSGLMSFPHRFVMESLPADSTLVVGTFPVDLGKMHPQIGVAFVRFVTSSTAVRSIVIVLCLTMILQ